MEYSKAEPIKLKGTFTEKWLQDIIEQEPHIIGLGELEVYRRERRQSSGGRIDFLMINSDNTTMYEVEIMLGATDESHIIRTIEYWDLEKRRFPSREHKAVIIAESITNRFFNVISLMNKSIPIIAIQLNAFKYNEKVFLDFVKVLDIYESPEDEIDIGLEAVDRNFWVKKSSDKSIMISDEIIKFCLIEYPELKTTYNKHHIAVGTISKNFLWLFPRKTDGYCLIEIFVNKENIESLKSKIESIGTTYAIRKDKIIAFPITYPNFKENIDIVKEIIITGLKDNK